MYVVCILSWQCMVAYLPCSSICTLIGKTKAIGVSNYTVRHLEELINYATVKPHVLQVCNYCS